MNTTNQLTKNFSRETNAESVVDDDFSIKMKSRKLAFTSRIMRPLKKVDLIETKPPQVFTAAPKFN